MTPPLGGVPCASSCRFGTEVANPNIQAIFRSGDETVNLIRRHRIGNHDFLQGIDGEGELAGHGGLVTSAVVRLVASSLKDRPADSNLSPR